MHTNIAIIAALSSLGLAFAVPAQTPEGCTSAVVSPAASAQHVPVLWKSRDTGNLSNKVVFVEDAPYSYLGLVDSDVPSGRQVFAGLNSVGFGIMNTVAYNLPKPAGEMEDLEGIIMADALRTCRTVDDFERHVQANLGPNLGSWANFGVIDAQGNACLFEVHNHGFQKHDVAEARGGYLVNTNFSRSGAEGRGQGYLRHERATRLFAEFVPGEVDFRTILTRHTRDLGHVLLDQPDLDQARRTAASRALWIYTGDCIDRPSTAAATVIVGRDPSDPDSVATMWVIPGEPVTAIAIPLWVEAGCSPAAVWEGEDAAMWRESKRIKAIARPLREGHKAGYLNLTRLCNADGSGFLSRILETEAGILAETREFLQTRHSAGEYAEFQDVLARRALAALKGIR